MALHPVAAAISGLQALQHPFLLLRGVVRDIRDAYRRDLYHALGASALNAAGLGRGACPCLPCVPGSMYMQCTLCAYLPP